MLWWLTDDETLADEIKEQAIGKLADHSIAAARLPLHHRDPFDRMLVAQARMENLTLVTRDSNIRRYDVPILAA